MADTTVTVSGKGEKRKIVFLIVFIVAAIVVAVLWWLDYRKYIRTDDANLDSFRVSVSAPVAGQVVRLYVMEGDTVKRGDTLLMLDHSACTVMAPVDGIIGKRWILPGDRIEAGQTALTLNRGTDIWVAVYLEETKFKEIYLGQKAQFTLDAYDKLTFEGRVYYIGDNTASEFALVPPNNASGNFTKVTQRIPLKISIDKVEGDDEQKARVKLVSGMSATVKIKKERP